MTITKSTPSTDKVTFKWTSDSKATGYIVEYSTSADLSNSKKGKWDRNYFEEYYLQDLTENTTYYYRIRSFKGAGEEREYSDWTSVSSITTKAKTVTADTDKSVTLSPSKIKLKSVKNNRKKAITVKWKRSIDADGYQISYSKKKSFAGAKKKNVTYIYDSITIKKLSKGKTYYVRARAFTKDNYGNKVYGKWSEVKKVKIKK